MNGLRQNCERTESGQFADFAQCPGAFQVYKKPRNYYLFIYQQVFIAFILNCIQNSFKIYSLSSI